MIASVKASELISSAPQLLAQLLAQLKVFPWRVTAHTLRQRFREDRLGLTASSLTFTTTIALVPFFTVALAVFTAFPMFAKMQGVLQTWLVESLIPDQIARQVLSYLNQFASKANRLGVVGLAALLVTALALILTIDKTLNNIWRVRKSRPWAQRVLIYWAAITLGPLLLALSLSLTSYVLTGSRGITAALPGSLRLLLDALQFLLLAAGTAALYRYVPNTQVKWSHAWVGGMFVATAFELAKKGLAWYVGSLGTFSTVYGAFAIVPILLLWIYVAWVIVLLGAVIAAYLPSLLSGVARRGGTPGWRFQLALEVLQVLHERQGLPEKGLAMASLAQWLRVDSLQLEPVLLALQELDWVGQLQDEHARYVLLASPQTTPLAPLMTKLLLQEDASTHNFRKISQWPAIYLRDVLQNK
jgi:membrane protein